MITDPIADLLTRLRNAARAKRDRIVVPHSKAKMAVLEVLKKHQLIGDYSRVKTGAFDEIEVLFNPLKKTLNLKRISKPGQRIYIKKTDIKPVRNHYGIAVLSTPKGVMTGEEAMKAGVGGEYICQAW